MLYLTAQIWFYLLMAFALGSGMTWWWFRRRLDGVQVGEAITAGDEHRNLQQAELVATLRSELDAARTEARIAKNELVATKDSLNALRAHPPRHPSTPRSRDGSPKLPDSLVSRAEPASSVEDDLTRIRGVGPVLAGLLNEMGIHTFRQIAGWSSEDIDRVQAQLPRFPDRIRRDDWVSQAAELDAHDT